MKPNRSRYAPVWSICCEPPQRARWNVLVVTDIPYLHCGRAELDGLLMSLLQYGIHTFGAKNGPVDRAGRTALDDIAGV